MKRLLLILLALTGIFIVGAGLYLAADEPVALDPAFEKALEIEYGIQPGSFSPDRVAGMTELDVSGYGITDLSGIEHFQSLVSLDARDNLLQSVEGIEALETLEQVDLSFNLLTDVAFSSVVIHTIDLEGNRLASLEFVAEMPGLRELNVRDNKISELEPVRNAHTLRSLNLRGNRIENVEPVSQLQQLTDLNIRNNRIQDFAPLQELPNLRERLYVTGNPSADFSAVQPMIRSIKDVDFGMSLAPPEISVPGGIVSGGMAVELTADAEHGFIFYTLDGSEPSAASAKYEGPIDISREAMEAMPVQSNTKTSISINAPSFEAGQVKDAIVLRASVYYRGQFSPTVTETYFLDEQPFAGNGMPVLSIAMDPADLFSMERGIYVPGNFYDKTKYSSEGNYFQRGGEWERKAHLQWFEGDRSRAFEQTIGVRIHGGYSRSLPQKSLRLYARSDWGASEFSHPIFGEDNGDAFDRIILRNAGNDHAGAFFRDALMHSLVEDGPVDGMAYKPAIVLLNGEYWGIHNIRNAQSVNWLQEQYHVQEQDAVILETDLLDPDGIVVDEGTEADVLPFLELLDYAETHDLREEPHMAHIEQQIDVDNYLHYVAYQVYFGNTDSFANNMALWRKRTLPVEDAPYGHDGRWRWLLYDTDQGFGGNPNITDPAEHNTLAWALEEKPQNRLTIALLENEDVQQRFEEIMEGLLDQEFAPDRVTGIIDEMERALQEEMPRHIQRWGTPESMTVWQSAVAELRTFAQERPDAIREHLAEQFDGQ